MLSLDLLVILKGLFYFTQISDSTSGLHKMLLAPLAGLWAAGLLGAAGLLLFGCMQRPLTQGSRVQTVQEISDCLLNNETSYQQPFNRY